MRYGIQWLRSLLFNVLMYVAMAVIGIVLFPWALVSALGARVAARLFSKWVRFSLHWIVGLRTEIRGIPPTCEVMIASKHQSFLDIIMIVSAVPSAKFIMKRELLWAPVLGQYALRMGCIPVDRGKRSAAIKKMMIDVAKGAQQPGQLVIYPQGTRVAPGATAPYKTGTGALYLELGQDCVPAATNVGLFWPRHGILRKPGVAVVEFLPPIAAGQSRNEFMSRLEREVESASNALMREAGFDAKGADRIG